MQTILIAQSQVYYYIREGFWSTMQKFCQEQYKAFGDPFFIFWKAYGLYQEGQPNEAINELTSIQHKKEIQYATIVALITCHLSTNTVDRETVQNLKFEESTQRRLSSDKAICLAALFYAFNKEHSKARDLIDEIHSDNFNIRIASAWCYLLEGGKFLEKSVQLFEELYNEQHEINKNLESLMGRSKANEMIKKFDISLNTINEINVLYPDFKGGLIEKAKLLMTVDDWEQLVDYCNKILYDDDKNIMALMLLTFYTFAREGDVETGCERLQKLIQAVEFSETRNMQLMFKISQVFSRISGRNTQILKFTMKLVNQCKQLSPLNAQYFCELAQQLLMVNQFERAEQYFQEASAIDVDNKECLMGLILSKIMQGQTEDAESQIDFINQTANNGERTAEIAFLEALVSTKQENTDPRVTIKLLEESLKLHIAQANRLYPSFDFYIVLNPDFLMSLSQAYFFQVGMKEMLAGKQPQNGVASKGTKLLDFIIKKIPGLIPAYLLQAKGKMSMGYTQEALKSVTKVIEQDPKNEEAYILSAMIASASKNFSLAQNQLQQALSNNFMIRDNPLFMLVKGEVEYAQGSYQTCLETMKAAYEIPEVKDKASQSKVVSAMSVLQFSDKDRCSIYLLYAKALQQNNNSKEAKKIMTQAISQFTGTTEEVNVLIANSEIALQSGDVKKAISILKGVPQESPYFLRARQILADVYLDQLRDRRNYAKCYADLIEIDPSFDNYKMLGDALMKIREPEEASRAYEKAALIKPDDEQIIQLLGLSLCQTHDYNKALTYYENALRMNPKRLDLIIDLGKLCIQIKNFNRAEEILKPDIFSDEYQLPTYQNLKRNQEGFYLIAKLNIKRTPPGEFKPIDMYRKALKKSIQIQVEVIEKAKQEGEDVEKERKAQADMYIELAKYTNQYEKNDKATLDTLVEASKYTNNQDTMSKTVGNQEKILELEVEVYFKSNQKLECENKCNLLLKLNPNNDLACLTLAELLLQKDEYSQAIEQFKKILQDRPNNYGILAKLIDFFRRSFQINEAKTYIERAEKKATNTNDPGLCYCRGLYHKYNRSPKDALNEFSKAKKSSQYAEESLVNMIDIYLNPDQDLYYSNVEEGPKAVDEVNLRACESLLREMQTRSSYLRYIVMESYVFFLGGARYKGGLEQGLKNLNDILKTNNDYIPAMLALAVGKFIQKKSTDAKNLLKLLWKRQYTTEYGEDLERAWLLSADSFIAIQKYDSAEEILKKCLKYNQSCGKAEEYMGLIKEKEQSYVDAATHYEKAYKLTNEKSASIAFRLSFNYLKAKRYVDCINICKKILELFPNYPKIEKDCLEKARQALK
ncbi:hypothetical protein ABPG72_000960 [Tetrahymena utriculariae]